MRRDSPCPADRTRLPVRFLGNENKIRVAPDTEVAGYPANLFCRISGQSVLPDIRYPAQYPTEKGVTKKQPIEIFSIPFTVFEICITVIFSGDLGFEESLNLKVLM